MFRLSLLTAVIGALGVLAAPAFGSTRAASPIAMAGSASPAGYCCAPKPTATPKKKHKAVLKHAVKATPGMRINTQGGVPGHG